MIWKKTDSHASQRDEANLPTLSKYTPILNDKQAELHALASLSEAMRGVMTPIVQLRHPVRSDKALKSWTPVSSLLERLQNPNDGIVGCWGSDRPIGIDLRLLRLREFDQSPMDELFERCADIGIKAIPVTGREQSQEARGAAARAARRLGNGACIRIVGDDLGIGTAGLRIMLAELDIPRESIDLIFDLGDIPTANTFLLDGVVSASMASFTPLGDWRSVALVGTSFPSNLSSVVEHNSFNLIARVEQSLWRRVCSSVEGRPSPTFGDYGIVSTDQSPGFKGAANLRYAVKDQWYILRGQPRETATSYDYLGLAKELRAQDVWRSTDHCAGCRFIQDRIEDGNPGNATQWREAGFAHHFAVVGESLGYP